MSAQDWSTIIGACAAAIVLLLGALMPIFVQVRKTHQLVNSRMQELLELTRSAAMAEGKLQGNEPTALHDR